MKKLILLLILATIVSTSAKNINVTTTIFPLYDFAKIIGGDDATVSLLLPPGVEPHSFEPTPKDIVKISKTDVFIYTSPSMEPWVKDIVSTIDSPNLHIVEVAHGIDEDESSGEDHHSHGEQCNHSENNDPHIWLDPILAIEIVENIILSFEKKIPTSKGFRVRGDSLKNELKELDIHIKAQLSPLKNRTIVSGGHFAFTHFVERYNLNQISPFSSFSPDAEPSPKAVAKIITTIKNEGYKAIYFEELVNSRVAKTIAKETGAKLLLLHGAHNVSATELKSGIGYIEIMQGNISRIVEGLK
jgi:zinc transport system substrate-binding protein